MQETCHKPRNIVPISRNQNSLAFHKTKDILECGIPVAVFCVIKDSKT